MRSANCTGSTATIPTGPIFSGTIWAITWAGSLPAKPLDEYVLRQPRPKMPLYHLIGALDPLEDGDVVKSINDGLPETLREWIRADGLTHLKIKLNGDDLRLGRGARGRASIAWPGRRSSSAASREWYYSLDFNERCANVALSARIPGQGQGAGPAGFERMQYIEQPTARDLKADSGNVMHEAAQDSAGGDRRIAGRSGKPAAGPRHGLHRRGPEGVQGPEPIAAAGRRRPEVRHVSVRAGFDVSRRLAHSIRQSGRPHSHRRRHRIECPAVLSRPPTSRGRKSFPASSASPTAP